MPCTMPFIVRMPSPVRISPVIHLQGGKSELEKKKGKKKGGGGGNQSTAAP